MLKTVYVNAEPRSWRFFTGHAEWLRCSGFDVYGVSSPGAQFDAFAAHEGLIALEVPISRSISPLKDILSVARLVWAFRRLRPDVVHAHFSKPGLLGILAATIARTPIRIYHNHGMAMCSATGLTRLILHACEWISCSLAHTVIYTSPSLRRAAVVSGVCRPDKAKVILSINGLDAKGRFNPAALPFETRRRRREAYGIPQDAFVLGYCGRILRIKGIVELADAWRRLRSDYKHVHLLMVGEFDDRDALPAGVEGTLKNDPRVHLVGHQEDMPSVYAAMDTLVLPSYHEGLGYVVIEASAMELPVVATRIPGAVDAVVEDVTGTLVEAKHSQELSSAIARYIESAQLRKSHGQAGRAYVLRAFSPERVRRELVELYGQLVAAKGLAVSTEQPPTTMRTIPTGMAGVGKSHHA